MEQGQRSMPTSASSSINGPATGFYVRIHPWSGATRKYKATTYIETLGAVGIIQYRQDNGNSYEGLVDISTVANVKFEGIKYILPHERYAFNSAYNKYLANKANPQSPGSSMPCPSPIGGPVYTGNLLKLFYYNSRGSFKTNMAKSFNMLIEEFQIEEVDSSNHLVKETVDIEDVAMITFDGVDFDFPETVSVFLHTFLTYMHEKPTSMVTIEMMLKELV